ncbi:TIR domain-containing protein [bacterium]|nr:TIR domain-containing protein [bacterium]
MIKKIMPPFKAYEGDASFTFISYSHCDIDRKIVFSDIKMFHDRGYNLWYDEGIEGGDRWTLTITENLKKASKIILFVSPRSVQSDNIASEINIGKNSKTPILPIMIEPTSIAGTELEYLIGMRNILDRSSMPKPTYIKKIRAFLDKPVKKGKPVPAPVSQLNTKVVRSNEKLLMGLVVLLSVIIAIMGTLYFTSGNRQTGNQMPPIQEITSLEKALEKPDFIKEQKTGAPKKFPVYFMKHNAKKQEYEQSEKICREILDKNPSHIEARRYLKKLIQQKEEIRLNEQLEKVRKLIRTGNLKVAWEILKSLPKRNKDVAKVRKEFQNRKVRILKAKGNDAFINGEYKAAKKFYERVDKLQFGHTDVHERLVEIGKILDKQVTRSGHCKLSVNTIPTGSRIVLIPEGEVRPWGVFEKSLNNMDVPMGKYTLLVHKFEYVNDKRFINLENGKPYVYTVQLKKVGAANAELFDGLKTRNGLPGDGLQILKVTVGTKPYQAGFRTGDLIRRVENIPVDTEKDLLDILKVYYGKRFLYFAIERPGLNLNIRYDLNPDLIEHLKDGRNLQSYRNRQKALKRTQRYLPEFGVSTMDDRRGVFVVNVPKGSKAENYLNDGDYITAVNYKLVLKTADLIAEYWGFVKKNPEIQRIPLSTRQGNTYGSISFPVNPKN